MDVLFNGWKVVPQRHRWCVEPQCDSRTHQPTGSEGTQSSLTMCWPGRKTRSECMVKPGVSFQLLWEHLPQRKRCWVLMLKQRHTQYVLNTITLLLKQARFQAPTMTCYPPRSLFILLTLVRGMWLRYQCIFEVLQLQHISFQWHEYGSHLQIHFLRRPKVFRQV